MKKDSNTQVVGTLWVERVTEDDGIAVVHLDPEFSNFSPDVICPALDQCIAILSEIRDHYESMHLANNQGDISPESRHMN